MTKAISDEPTRPSAIVSEAPAAADVAVSSEYETASIGVRGRPRGAIAKGRRSRLIVLRGGAPERKFLVLLAVGGDVDGHREDVQGGEQS